MKGLPAGCDLGNRPGIQIVDSDSLFGPDFPVKIDSARIPGLRMRNLHPITMPPSTTKPVLHIMGDSISLQYRGYLRTHLQKSFRCTREGQEAAALKNLDLPTGANAGDSSAVLVRIQNLLERSKLRPDVILLNCGLHDIKFDPAARKLDIPLARYNRNLSDIVACIRKAKVDLIWVRTTHSVDTIHNRAKGPAFHRFAKDGLRYNQAADKVMNAHGVPVVDLNGFTRTLGKDEEIFCDHVHFVDSVRQRQAAFLAGWLISWKERSSSKPRRGK